jgi:murein DD-endopeptidase MepM/ murein hydrolase activator NlpD
MATRIGQTVQVTASTGLKARTSPNGAQAKDSKGKPVVRPKGFRFQVRGRKQAGGKWWVRAKSNWYAEQYVAAVSAVKASGKVSSPAPGYRVTTPFGKKPRNNSYWQARKHHTGDDYAAPSGAKAVAVRSGTVKYKWDGTLGHCALLQGKDGAGRKRTWWYCHLRSKPNTGSVKPGQTIGHVGSTGSGAQGPHLHFEMRNGYTTSWAGKDLKPSW